MKSEDWVPTLAITAVAMVAAAAVLSRKERDHDKTKEKAEAKPDTWKSHVVNERGPLSEVWPGTLYTLEAGGAGRGPPRRNMHIYRVPDDDDDGGDGSSRSSSNRRLVVFNGIAVREETMREIEKLGTPAVLVVPNWHHRCCAGVWKRRYPAITVVCPRCAVDKAREVVPVDISTQEWAQQKEWSQWVHAKEIDGWGEFETVLELELDKSGSGSGKKAVLVCDILFTMPNTVNRGTMDKLLAWVFDSCITLPEDGSIVIPKVTRISRIFAIQDWPKAERWFRSYAKEEGPKIAAILVGHGVPIKEVNAAEGCTKALEGVADQLIKKRW